MAIGTPAPWTRNAEREARQDHPALTSGYGLQRGCPPGVDDDPVERAYATGTRRRFNRTSTS